MRGTTYWWRHRKYGGDEETRQGGNSGAQELVRMKGKQEVLEEEETVFVGKKWKACEGSHIKGAH